MVSLQKIQIFWVFVFIYLVLIFTISVWFRSYKVFTCDNLSLTFVIRSECFKFPKFSLSSCKITIFVHPMLFLITVIVVFFQMLENKKIT